MLPASYSDKSHIVSILADCFFDNKSVNYIITKGIKKSKRVNKLMEYSFDYCYWFGEILLTEDKTTCALILYPDKKKVTLKSIIADFKLIFLSIGLRNLIKAMRRESKIKKIHPDKPIAYLWYIGVNPPNQNKGSGTVLLKQIIKKFKTEGRQIVLETSTERNLPWYIKNGFIIYNKLNFGYMLYCLKSE